MSYRISWGPETGFVSILTNTAQDALLLAADFERRGLPAMVSEMDGTPLTSFDLELIVVSQADRIKRQDS